jgi:hypothetical protein
MSDIFHQCLLNSASDTHFNYLFFYSFFLQKLLKAAGLFAGSIFLMRNFGDLMAV